MSKKAVSIVLSVMALGGGFSAAVPGLALAGDDNHAHQLNRHHK